jgi:hypothetical protein
LKQGSLPAERPVMRLRRCGRRRGLSWDLGCLSGSGWQDDRGGVAGVVVDGLARRGQRAGGSERLAGAGVACVAGVGAGQAVAGAQRGSSVRWAIGQCWFG